MPCAALYIIEFASFFFCLEHIGYKLMEQQSETERKYCNKIKHFVSSSLTVVIIREDSY